MKLSEYDNVISAYGDLRSGHFCDLPIIRQWAKINSVIFTLAQAYLNGITSYRTVFDNSSKHFHRKVI